MPVTTPRGPLKEIHVTDRRIFKQCRNQYRFQIIERIAPITDKVDALYIGTGCHHSLAARYFSIMNKERPGTLYGYWQEWIEGRNKVRMEKGFHVDLPNDETSYMIQGILSGYEDYYADIDYAWEILGVEVSLRSKIPGTNVTLVGTIDMLVRHRGLLWVVDHKFLRAIGDGLVGQLEMDDQMTAYIWLLRENGINVVGAIYNVIRKKAPTRPQLLVAGGLSKNKSIDTTYEVYLDEIYDKSLNPDDYEDILTTLKAKGNTFYHREIVRRNPKELDWFQHDLTAEARDMTSKNTVLYPSQGMQCGWCKYRSLCKGEREGADVAYTRNAQYRLKEDDER